MSKVSRQSEGIVFLDKSDTAGSVAVWPKHGAATSLIFTMTTNSCRTAALATASLGRTVVAVLASMTLATNTIVDVAVAGGKYTPPEFGEIDDRVIRKQVDALKKFDDLDYVSYNKKMFKRFNKILRKNHYNEHAIKLALDWDSAYSYSSFSVGTYSDRSRTTEFMESLDRFKARGELAVRKDIQLKEGSRERLALLIETFLMLHPVDRSALEKLLGRDLLDTAENEWGIIYDPQASSGKVVCVVQLSPVSDERFFIFTDDLRSTGPAMRAYMEPVMYLGLD